MRNDDLNNVNKLNKENETSVIMNDSNREMNECETARDIAQRIANKDRMDVTYRESLAEDLFASMMDTAEEYVDVNEIAERAVAATDALIRTLAQSQADLRTEARSRQNAPPILYDSNHDDHDDHDDYCGESTGCIY